MTNGNRIDISLKSLKSTAVALSYLAKRGPCKPVDTPVVLSVTADGWRLSVNDSSMNMDGTVVLGTTGNGCVIPDATWLGRATKRFAGVKGVLALTIVDNKLTIRHQDTGVQVSTTVTDIGDLPVCSWQEPDNTTKSMTVAGAQLAGAIAQSYCMSTDESRVALNGMHWQHAPKHTGLNHNYKTVCTDGHRMTVSNCESVSGTTVPDATWERTDVECVGRLLKWAPSLTVTIEHIDNNTAVVRTNKWLVVVSLVDKAYPDWKKITLKNNVTVPTDTRLTALCKGTAEIVIRSNGQLEFTARDKDGTEVGGFVDNSFETYDEFAVCFDARYLADAIKHTDASCVYLNDTNYSYSPATLRSPDDDVLAIVMPIRI